MLVPRLQNVRVDLSRALSSVAVGGGTGEIRNGPVVTGGRRESQGGHRDKTGIEVGSLVGWLAIAIQQREQERAERGQAPSPFESKSLGHHRF